MKKRLLSILLALCMAFTLLPGMALAAEGEAPWLESWTRAISESGVGADEERGTQASISEGNESLLKQATESVITYDTSLIEVKTHVPVLTDYSDEYMSSSFYWSLMNVALTGDYRTDIINIAESQIGYHEGSNAYDINGSSTGSENYSEYGRWLGSNGSAWCSEFASWCIRQAGVPERVIANSRSANILRFNAPYFTWEQTVFGGGAYLPQAGDLVLFAWTGTSPLANDLSHTAIVKSVQVGENIVKLTVIHGNSNDMVRESTYNVALTSGFVSSGQIVYFVAPDYDLLNIPEVTADYIITFAPNGGYGSMSPVTITVGADSNVNYTLPVCAYIAPTGKEFDCWQVGGKTYDAGDTVLLTGDTTVIAVWKDKAPVEYLVTFSSNGGNGTMPPQTVIASDDGTVWFNLPKCQFTSPAGKEFDCWYVSGVAYDPGDTVLITGDTTIKAVWKERISSSCTITFIDQQTGKRITTYEAQKGEAIGTLPTAPTHDGYTFQGWYDASGKTVSASTKVTGNMTVYARYQEKSSPSTPDFTFNFGFDKMTFDPATGTAVIPVEVMMGGIPVTTIDITITLSL